MPAARLLGMELGARSDREAHVSLAARPELLQVDGVVHGGILATLADTAAVHLLYPQLASERSMTSIEFKLNFLRPATAGGGPIDARARVAHMGRKVCLAEVDVEQAGKIVAKGLFTYLVL